MDKIVVDMINERLDRMETKIDTLISFRFQALGGLIVICGLFSLVFKLIEIYFNR